MCLNYRIALKFDRGPEIQPSGFQGFVNDFDKTVFSVIEAVPQKALFINSLRPSDAYMC